MRHFLQMTHYGQHRQHRVYHHPTIPLSPPPRPQVVRKPLPMRLLFFQVTIRRVKQWITVNCRVSWCWRLPTLRCTDPHEMGIHWKSEVTKRQPKKKICSVDRSVDCWRDSKKDFRVHYSFAWWLGFGVGSSQPTRTVCEDHNLTDCGTRIIEVSVELGGIRRTAWNWRQFLPTVWRSQSNRLWYKKLVNQRISDTQIL